MSRLWSEPTSVVTPLRRRLVVVTAAFAVGLFVLSALFGYRWFAVSALVGGYLVGYTAYHLDGNRSDGGHRHATLGLANGVTLFRGWLLAVLAGFVLVSPPTAWMAVALFVTAAVLDVVDGAVARRTRKTALGARLDGSVDALAVLIGSAVAVSVGALPAWYILAGAVWYCYAGGLWVRRASGDAVYALPPSSVRTAIGSAQLVVIAAALVPGSGGWLLSGLAALALATLLASFARDWAAATGRLGRQNPPVAG